MKKGNVTKKKQTYKKKFDDWRNHLKKIVDKNLDSIFTISTLHPLTWNIIDGKIKSNYNYKQRPRRQDFTDNKILYDENGSVYIFTREHFELTNNRLGGKIGYIIFDEEYGHEIDTPQDLKILEQISRDILNS